MNKKYNYGKIESFCGEYNIYIEKIINGNDLKLKVKVIYKNDNLFYATTNIGIIRKYDSYPEWCGGFGKTINEAIVDAVKNFNMVLDTDYPEGITLDDIRYCDYSEF